MLGRLSRTSAFPLTLALQGVSLTLLALFLSPASSTSRKDAAAGIGTGDLPSPPRLAATELEIPRDLARERLPVPNFPDPDDGRPSPAPKPKTDAPKAPIQPGPELAALRVENVALASLALVNLPAPLPGPPDSLEPHEISGGSGRSWLSRPGQGGRRAAGGDPTGPSDTGRGNGGWIGTGHGGSGRGMGGSCAGRGGGSGRGRPLGTPGTVERPAGGSGAGAGTTGRGAGGRPGSAGEGRHGKAGGQGKH